MFKWGIIGCGRIAGKFVEAAQSLDGVYVEATASRSIEKSREFARTYGIPRAYGSYEELLESDIDAVYIATVNSAHYECLMLCLEHGVPVLCEKPMLMTLAEFDRVTALAKDKKVALMEAMWTSFLPSINKIKELIDGGAIGNPLYAGLNFIVNFRDEPDGRIFNPALGGGLIFDIGVYNLHIAFTLFGHKYGDIKITGKKGATGVDTASVITLDYPGGPLVNTVTADGIGPYEINIVGKAGGIRAAKYNGAEQVILTGRDGAETVYNCPFDKNGFEYEAAEFVKIVSEGRLESDIVSIKRSRRVCEIMERAYNQICGEDSRLT